MRFETGPGPHLPIAGGVGAVMRQVLYALIPAALIHVWTFGPGLIFNMAIAAGAAVGSEWVVLRLRGRAASDAIADSSALVAAVLLAFALPSVTPWWVTATGAVFAIVVAKQLYGGLGFNTFNPAMAGYVVLLVAFPTELALWPAPRGNALDVQNLSVMQNLWVTLSGRLPAELSWDAVTMATPLDAAQTGVTGGLMMSEMMSGPALGPYGGGGWLAVNLAIAAGGIFLLVRGIIRWHIPVSMLAALLIMATVFYGIDPDHFAPPLFHLLSGAAMLGAFFIATDPVSAAASTRGRLIYGAGIGVLTYLIRAFGSFPDGVAFAVLLMNMTVPIIDYFVKPRAYGHR